MSNLEPVETDQLEDQSSHGQVSRSAAQVYEEYFVPALFEQWTSRVIEAAQIKPGQRVLDVACGTGVLARAVAEHVGLTDLVVGVDINEGMLDVAKQKAPDIEWRHGKAESLPFDSDSFDAAVSQFGLMFFADPYAAIQEMTRVIRPGGYMAVAVWDSLENSPGYAALVELLDRIIGSDAANALRAPFSLGDQDRLRALFSAAGTFDFRISTHPGTARFPSISSWIYTDVKGWTFADRIDDGQFALLLEEAQHVLQPFVLPDGSVAFSAPAHIVIATK